MIRITWGKSLGVLCLMAMSALAGAQGQLVPPSGPIMPTGRSLDEIMPSRTIDSIPFRITANGVYHVTKNLQAGPGQNGIVIDDAVDYAEIDLGGFTLRGPGDGTGIGLLLPAVQKVREAAARMECRNGNIVGFNIGVHLGLQSSPTPSGHNYLQYEMENVLISSYSVNGAGVQILMGDGSVRMVRCSLVKNGADGLQINPALQDFRAEACDFSNNGGNGVNILPAVQSPAPTGASEASPAVAGTDGDVDGRDFLIWRSSLSNNGLNGLFLQATPTGTPNVVPTEQLSLNFEEIKFNRNGLNGFSVGSGPTSLPAEQLSLNFTKVEFNYNGQAGFKFEKTSSDLPMESISFNFAKVEYRYNGQTGLYYMDHTTVGDPVGGQIGISDFIASNNGADGILIGLLLPAVQKVREAAATRPHVSLVDGRLDNNAANGAHIKEAKLTCRKTGGDGNQFYAYKLEDVLVSSFHGVSGVDNGQGGLNIIGILIGLLQDCQFNGNGGHGVEVQGGGTITFTGLECHENTSNGVQCEGSVINMSQCKLTKNAMKGASLMTMKGSKILQNVISENAQGGLSITDGTSNTIMFNELSENGQTALAITGGSRNVIQDNSILGNALGLNIGSAGNFIFRNVLNNTNNASIVQNNEVGPMQTLGNLGASPFANIVPSSPN